MAKPRLFNSIVKIVGNETKALEIVKLIAESKSPDIIKKAKYEHHHLSTYKSSYTNYGESIFGDWDNEY